ncbi:unnamed protein product, partial [Choristocarpus tenellus]
MRSQPVNSRRENNVRGYRLAGTLMGGAGGNSKAPYQLNINSEERERRCIQNRSCAATTSEDRESDAISNSKNTNMEKDYSDNCSDIKWACTSGRVDVSIRHEDKELGLGSNEEISGKGKGR